MLARLAAEVEPSMTSKEASLIRPTVREKALHKEFLKGTKEALEVLI